MKIAEVIRCLETLAPTIYLENYDNSGLLTGDGEWELKKVLITLDCTEEVISEAITLQCNLIIAHHPLIFKPLKTLTGKGPVPRAVISAIKNDISIYALHTNLDNVVGGVNFKIASLLSLDHCRVLTPKAGTLKKLITFIPVKETERVLKALHLAGAGNIGNYSECSFIAPGTGSFRPGVEAHPSIGKSGKVEIVTENKAEVIFPAYLENKLIKALKQSHPYEEPAYDLISLDNQNSEVGSGVIGELNKEMDEKEFLKFLKSKMNLSQIRHSPFTGKMIRKIALCGGAGSFLLGKAKKEGADVFISSDFKYHEFFDADGEILIADINHYEGEVYTKDLIYEYLTKNLPNIALVLSDIKTNPISYL